MGLHHHQTLKSLLRPPGLLGLFQVDFELLRRAAPLVTLEVPRKLKILRIPPTRTRLLKREDQR